MRAKLDSDLIKKLHCEDKLPTEEIAKRLGCWPGSISRVLHRLGCARSESEALKLACAQGRIPNCIPGETNPSWKGGKYQSNGYAWVKCPSHSGANSEGYILEHRLIWEQTHNRQLPKGWTVHHLNGIKSDNRPSNLVAMPCKKHAVLIPALQEKIRLLEIENRQLRKAFEDSQMILYMNEN